MEAVIFVGIQGSGKTTFFRERFFETHIRLNLDMLRTRHREKLLFQSCLEAKAKFVVDNTNTLKAERARYLLAARQSRFLVIGYYFVPDLQGCLNRNAKRTSAVSIPEKAIVATRRQLQEPSFDEGFDEIYAVEILDNGEFQVRKIEQ